MTDKIKINGREPVDPEIAKKRNPSMYLVKSTEYNGKHYVTGHAQGRTNGTFTTPPYILHEANSAKNAADVVKHLYKKTLGEKEPHYSTQPLRDENDKPTRKVEHCVGWFDNGPKKREILKHIKEHEQSHWGKGK